MFITNVRDFFVEGRLSLLLLVSSKQFLPDANTFKRNEKCLQIRRGIMADDELASNRIYVLPASEITSSNK